MSSPDKRTSTFVFDHALCDPSAWTAQTILTFAEFIRSGNLNAAAKLARIGVRLVASEHHEAAGGTMEFLGYVNDPEDDFPPTKDLADLDLEEGAGPTEIVPLYRGPAKYAVPYEVVDTDVSDWATTTEYKVCDTLAEGQLFLAGLEGGGSGE